MGVVGGEVGKSKKRITKIHHYLKISDIIFSVLVENNCLVLLILATHFSRYALRAGFRATVAATWRWLWFCLVAIRENYSTSTICLNLGHYQSEL